MREEKLVHTLKIGNVELKNNILLAPMAGITDKVFRKICTQYEAGLTFTEMASAKALYYNDTKTEQLIDIKDEQNAVIQIFGSDEASMIDASQKISKISPIIDINMGCPAPKVTKNGDGSKLLLNIKLAEKIASQVVKASTVPVTVKLRKGWDNDNVVAVEFAQMLQEAGVQMVTIHGRTKEEYYSGKVDLNIIKKVKESVKIPVIGNGDIKSEQDAQKMFEYTGVDGIMIGRASMGNPWIFKQIIHYLKTGKTLEITEQEKKQTMLTHLQNEIEYKGEKVAIREMRKHLACYIKNRKDAAKIRDNINKINDKASLIEYLNNI